MDDGKKGGRVGERTLKNTPKNSKLRTSPHAKLGRIAQLDPGDHMTDVANVIKAAQGYSHLSCNVSMSQISLPVNSG